MSKAHEAIKGILAYFESGNSVPVDKATIKADSHEVAALRAALAEPVAEGSVCARCGGLVFDPVLARPAAEEQQFTTCNCRWDGETQVQQCTLHKAHVDAIHDWAERAKTAEAKIKAQPVQEPVAWRWKYDFRDIGETGAYEYHSHAFACVARMPKGEPLYTAPQLPSDMPLLTEADEEFCCSAAVSAGKKRGVGCMDALAIVAAYLQAKDSRQKAGLK